MFLYKAILEYLQENLYMICWFYLRINWGINSCHQINFCCKIHAKDELFHLVDFLDVMIWIMGVCCIDDIITEEDSNG